MTGAGDLPAVIVARTKQQGQILKERVGGSMSKNSKPARKVSTEKTPADRHY